VIFVDGGGGDNTTTDCTDGVVHIPTSAAIIDEFIKAKTTRHVSVLEPFVTSGINATWFFPCHVPDNGARPDPCYPGATELQGTDQQQCSAAAKRQEPSLCFRGVHDDLVSDQEIKDTLRMGSYLISLGGDHFDIHYDTAFLEDRLPSTLRTLRNLLRDTYLIDDAALQFPLHPVAFRVNAVGPMNGDGVPLYGLHSSKYLVRIFNRTRYERWMDRAERRNEIAQFSLPWPFRLVRPKRDTCNLLADMEVDPRFAIQTTVFLSEGGGQDFRGGAALYVDYGDQARHKIRRGLVIDGSRGRVVVSTGGAENRRCRLPVRAGVRAALQIWWSCADASKTDDAS
jgi:hypothetical protein